MPQRVTMCCAAGLILGLVALVITGCEQSPRDRPPGLGPVVSNGYISIQLADDGMPTPGRDKIVVQSHFVHPASDERVLSCLVPAGMTILIDGKRMMPAEFKHLDDNAVESTSSMPGVSVQTTWKPAYDPIGLTETIAINVTRATGFSFEKVPASPSPNLPFQVQGQFPPDQILQPGSSLNWTRSWSFKDTSVGRFPDDQVSIEIDGPALDEQVIQSSLETLNREVSAGALGPFGITSDRYGGRMFWDADVYMMPALAFLYPDAADKIARDRVNQLPGAMQNYLAWEHDGFPVADRNHLNLTPSQDQAAIFAWEAGYSGEELSTAPTRFEAHGSASVIYGLRLAAANGDTTADVGKATKLVAAFYQRRVNVRPDGRWGLLDTISPDEWHTVNNDLYTNLAVAQCFKAAGVTSPDPAKVILPYDRRGLAQFDDDDFDTYQQAAGLLAVWPLQAPVAEKNAASLFDRYADNVATDGPAMSHQIAAIVASRIGRPKVAYREFSLGWQRFSDDPEWEFREKEQFKTGYFITGAAGIIDALLYGFLGFRIDDTEPLHKPWSHQLYDGRWLTIDPHLPPQWSGVTIKNLYIEGQHYMLEARTGQPLVMLEANG